MSFLVFLGHAVLFGMNGHINYASITASKYFRGDDFESRGKISLICEEAHKIAISAKKRSY